MGILDFLRKQSKNGKNSLVEKKGNFIEPSTPKKKKFRNIAEFIENALISNGGNYEDIHKKLLAISEFAKHAKDYGVKCNLGRVDEVLRDFFSNQSEIKFHPLKNAPHTALYTKKDGYNRYNYRGVTVFYNEQADKPIMFYGRRNENVETHSNDSLFAFGENVVILRDEWKSKYEEIPLFGVGTYADFYFDKDNHITSVKFRYMINPRLGLWSAEEVCEFDEQTNQYKLLPTQISEKKYNDPKPNKEGMRTLASTILGHVSSTKEDEENLDK